MPGTPCKHLLAVAAQPSKFQASNSIASAPKLETQSSNKATFLCLQIFPSLATSFKRPVVVSWCTAITWVIAES